MEAQRTLGRNSAGTFAPADTSDSEVSNLLQRLKEALTASDAARTALAQRIESICYHPETKDSADEVKPTQRTKLGTVLHDMLQQIKRGNEQLEDICHSVEL